MGMREFEGAIANELREIVGKRSIRVKDMMEWSTSSDVLRKNATADETVIHCPRCGVWVAIASSKVPKLRSALPGAGKPGGKKGEETCTREVR